MRVVIGLSRSACPMAWWRFPVWTPRVRCGWSGVWAMLIVLLMPPEGRTASLKEAETGDAQAMMEWAVELQGGENRDPLESARWMQKSAEAGNARAMWYLGVLYRTGGGVPQDSAASQRWFLKAAGEGLPEAQQELAMLCLRGENGFAVDQPQAREWARKAAESGLATGEYLYGVLLFTGKGGAKEPYKGIEWVERAARKGDMKACEMMRDLHEAAAERPGARQDLALAWMYVVALKNNDAKEKVKKLEAALKKEDIEKAQKERDGILADISKNIGREQGGAAGE